MTIKIQKWFGLFLKKTAERGTWRRFERSRTNRIRQRAIIDALEPRTLLTAALSIDPSSGFGTGAAAAIYTLVLNETDLSSTETIAINWGDHKGTIIQGI